MGVAFNAAMLSLAEANFFSTSEWSGQKQQMEVKARTNIRLGVSTTNVAGVILPLFDLRGEQRD